MNNFLKILLIFIFITNSVSSFFKILVRKKNNKRKTRKHKELLKKEEKLNFEFNPNLKIELDSKVIDKSFLKHFDNNNGRINYIGDLKNISKYKFKKIKNFHQYDPKILFYKNDIIFFTIVIDNFKKLDNKNLVWKKNIYTKAEKKQNPILLFANNR